MIAYWVPEDENVPARVTIIAIPSRKELCIRNLFSVADCRMHWQKNGDYLCVKVDRYSKSKKVEETGQMKYSVSRDSKKQRRWVIDDNLSQLMRLWYLSHSLARAFAVRTHEKYGS